MKKTFKMTHPKIKVPRLVEAIKYEVKKYIKRERGKTLPLNIDFWDFDCRYGVDEASAEVIHLSAINKCISQAEDEQLESFYLEILVKPGHRSKKPKPAPELVPELAPQISSEEPGQQDPESEA